HIALNTSVLPVKWTPARSRCESSTFEIMAASPATKLITPGGMPAASYSFIKWNAEYLALDAGFHTTAFPISAGAVGTSASTDVKLNGVTAYTNPSRPRYSTLFHAR